MMEPRSAAVALAFLAAACADQGPPSGVTELRSAPSMWEREGFVELVAAVPLPHLQGGATRVYVRIPAHATLALEGPHDAPQLRAPPGTQADRVEYITVAGAHGPVLTVADVRGSVVDAEGREQFHVLRPVAPGPGAELFGVSWPRQRADLGGLAHAWMAQRMAGDVGFARAPAHQSRDAAVRHFVGLQDCAGCHAQGKTAFTRPSERRGVVNRGSDARGWYSLLATLRDAAPLESYRPVQPAAHSPFVNVTCADGSKPTRDHRSGQAVVQCGPGALPWGQLDVKAGLAASDAHTRAVCRARSLLLPHLDAAVRSAFSEGLLACGLSNSPT